MHNTIAKVSVFQTWKKGKYLPVYICYKLLSRIASIPGVDLFPQDNKTLAKSSKIKEILIPGLGGNLSVASRETPWLLSLTEPDLCLYKTTWATWATKKETFNLGSSKSFPAWYGLNLKDFCDVF